MSIPFAGVIRVPRTIMSAVSRNVKMLNLKPVNKITVQFDPFYENVVETRNLLHYLSGPRVAKTNLNCVLKANVVCDRSEPTITCDLENGNKVLFKCANLNALEILQLFNKHITVLAPPEPKPAPLRPIKLKKQRVKIRTSRHRR
ncbi:hypothetical protein PV327_005926 [Microctonus hyperodae]|uniref:Large ribosomal subunit protein mL53 n=1 Tax=Microctonus hyperodae TaxID=165561 RepID=A0AA39L078_MICHY|nr:hypothetical protein PV327_005926 [Microctonus hyperodae]